MIPAAIVFDMDGVLVDSEPLHFRTTNLVLERRGARLEADAYEGFKGMTEQAFFEHLVRDLELTDRPEVLVKERLEAFLQAVAQEVLLPTDGALECLLGLHAEGYRLALASSSTRQQVELVVEKLGIRRVLHTLVSAEDARRGKPAPDLFLEAARRLDVLPDECLVVEDAVLGIVAARAAGMQAVALIDTDATGEAHRLAGAVTCIPSLRELTPDSIDRMAARKD
ncbi:MAG: HAD family hydrolase [Planctomycetota bacterium]